MTPVKADLISKRRVMHLEGTVSLRANLKESRCRKAGGHVGLGKNQVGHDMAVASVG